jgi:hypothetical protein
MQGMRMDAHLRRRYARTNTPHQQWLVRAEGGQHRSLRGMESEAGGTARPVRWMGEGDHYAHN